MIALGSNSLTRAKILSSANINFIQRGIEFDESKIEISAPNDYVYLITKGKFDAYLKQYEFDMPFVVADTVVCVANQILLKAKDVGDAKRMLKLQSGNNVEIITCMMYKSFYLELTDISVAKYNFSKFDEDDLGKYLQSGEWEGKAGACMVEGFCKPYIQSMQGLESTAMGLSVEKLLLFLE